MNATHYMELLSNHQPWNLILFMAIPVICAETLAITEFIILYSRNRSGKAALINRFTGIFAGLYFAGVFLYLFFNAVIPLTTGGDWRGPFDVIAVGFYLAGIIPYFGLFLLEIFGRKLEENIFLKLHGILVSIFLVVAHIAMIFGMLNPDLLKMTGMGM